MEEAVRTAKQKILQSWKEQTAAAKAVGASQEELAAITKRTQEMLSAVVDQSSTRVERKLGDASQAIKKQANAWTAENNRIIESEQAKTRALEVAALKADVLARSGAPAGGGGHTVSGQSAASGAVQLLDGRGGIRTIENFLGNTLGLGGFFSAMFPVVGAIQSAKLLAEMGEHVYEVRQKALEAGEAFAQAFGEIHAKNLTTIADLDLQAAKIQQNIDKLSGHPENGLAVMLAESRKFADSLASGLAEVRKQEEAIFKERSIGAFASVLSGQSSTGKQEKNLTQDAKDFEAKIAGINSAFDAKASNAGNLDTVKQLDKQRNAQIIAAFQERIDLNHREAKRLADAQKADEAAAQVGYSAYGARTTAPVYSNSGKIAELNGNTKQYEDQLALFKARQNIADLTEKENSLKGQKDAGRLASEASRKSLESQRKAAEEQRKQWDVEYAQFQASADKSHAQMAEFWSIRMMLVRKGSDNYLDAEKHYYEEEKRANQDHSARLGDFVPLPQEWADKGHAQMAPVLSNFTREGGQGIADAARTWRELQQAMQDAGISVAESTVQFEAQTGKISRADAAMQLQALHAEQYRLSLARLQEQMAAVSPGPQAEAQTNTIQRQMVELDSRRAVQAMQDDAAVAAETWRGALGSAIDEWVQHATDGAAQVRELITSSLTGLNSNLVDAAMNKRTNFSGLVEGTGKQVLSMGLDRLEAPLLGKLGLGKPDGTAANPMNVHVVNLPAMGGVGGTADAVAGMVTKSATDGIASEALQTALGFIPGGNLIGGLFGGLFGGHRALGGKVQAGMTYDVGEMGRESFTPTTDGVITPANKLGGVAYYTIHTNEGVTSEQVHQQVQSALREAHPRVVRDSINGVRDAQARRSNMR